VLYSIPHTQHLRDHTNIDLSVCYYTWWPKTHLRCGGIFSDSIITNFLLIMTVKTGLKIGQCLMKLSGVQKSVPNFWATLYISIVVFCPRSTAIRFFIFLLYFFCRFYAAVTAVNHQIVRIKIQSIIRSRHGTFCKK